MVRAKGSNIRTGKRYKPGVNWITKKYPFESGIYLGTSKNGEVDTAAFSAVNIKFNKEIVAWAHLPGGYKGEKK